MYILGPPAVEVGLAVWKLGQGGRLYTGNLLGSTEASFASAGRGGEGNEGGGRREKGN